MGSVGNPNPWSPYDNFKDCSLQICSIYCPQFCYFIFPPPPPSDEDDSTPFSPLIIAIIGVLASAFLLVSYYTIVTRFCRRRTTRGNQNEEINNHHDHESTDNHDQWQVGSTGLDEAVIKTIPFCKYVRGDGLIEGTECAVCLSEFQENESLRLLPKCSHAFHLPCIDTWLKSHSNCPLCRAGVGPLPGPVQDSSAAVDLDANNDDLVLTVDDDDGDNEVDDRIRVSDHDEESVKRLFRRSVSLGAFTIGPHFLISEVLKIEGNDGSSRGNIGNSSKGFAMRRSVSTGRIP